MARPKKSPDERRDAQLNTCLTLAERVQIERNAHLLGLTPAEFMRRRALGYSLPLSIAAQRDHARIGAALNRHGVNLNQIAYQLNAGRARPLDVSAALSALIARINAILDDFYDSNDNGGGPQL